MPVAAMTEAETEQALRIWEEYQRQHDLSSRQGQAVGIEPISGRIWFGETARDIRGQMDAEGIDRAFFCARVGAPAYLVKKGAPVLTGTVTELQHNLIQD